MFFPLDNRRNLELNLRQHRGVTQDNYVSRNPGDEGQWQSPSVISRGVPFLGVGGNAK
jgi:hypothetical protein